MEVGAQHSGMWKCSGSPMWKLSEKGQRAVLWGFIEATLYSRMHMRAQSCPTLCNPWIVACQAPLSMEFSRQEYRSGLPFPSSWDLLDPGIKSESSLLWVDSLPSELPGKPR